MGKHAGIDIPVDQLLDHQSDIVPARAQNCVHAEIGDKRIQVVRRKVWRVEAQNSVWFDHAVDIDSDAILA